MALHQEEKTMLRVLITQIDSKTGKVKEINGVKQEGGVIYDRLGEAMGYVYDHSKYDSNYNRKPEHHVNNWYAK